jgi:hypothetical protein
MRSFFHRIHPLLTTHMLLALHIVFESGYQLYCFEVL